MLADSSLAFEGGTGSPGGLAAIRIVLRGNSLSFFYLKGSMSWAPQCATGIMGALVVRASRAALVLRTIGHRSGSRLAVSG